MWSEVREYFVACVCSGAVKFSNCVYSNASDTAGVYDVVEGRTYSVELGSKNAIMPCTKRHRTSVHKATAPHVCNGSLIARVCRAGEEEERKCEHSHV